MATYLHEVDALNELVELSAGGQPTGSQDTDNSTTDLLGSTETFTGSWVTNSDAQIAFNVKADAPGDLYLEFSPDGGTTVTLSKRYDIQADEPRFDALVKMHGRSHRIRYVNRSISQTEFVLLTATGGGLFPFSKSDRDEPVFTAYSSGAVTATTYAILIDLSDTVNFPHSDTGRVDLYSSFLFVDRSSSATGLVRLGVITRIDGTDADVAYVQGVSFNNTADRIIERDRQFRIPLKLGQSGGELTRIATGFKATNIAAINTAITLPSPKGNVTPAIGDIVVEFEHTSGTYTASVSGQYAGNVSST